MAEELGRIERPEAEQFRGKRKLFLVPLLYSWQEAPAEYLEKFGQYWREVKDQIIRLEAQTGKVSRVYHESITIAGDEGLKIMERLSPASCEITRLMCDNGAQVEIIEDPELAEESMDWERHLLMGFISRKVADTVSQFFTESMTKRYEHIAKKLDETFGADETAVLFIREGHRIQFPADIEVFIVSPPALNEIHRWLRDRQDEEAPAQEEAAEPQETPETE